jgi:hypothetical protein
MLRDSVLTNDSAQLVITGVSVDVKPLIVIRVSGKCIGSAQKFHKCCLCFVSPYQRLVLFQTSFYVKGLSICARLGHISR